MAKSGNRYISCFVLLLAVALATNKYVHAQQIVTSEDSMARLMASDNKDLFDDFNESVNQVLKQDSATVFKQLAELEKKFATGNAYYKARFNCYMAWAKVTVTKHYSIAEVTDLTNEAMNYAFNTNDKYFIAYISWLCGSVMFSTPQFEAAVTFRLKVEDVYAETGYPKYLDSTGNWAVLGEALFHTGDYHQSILFTKKAIAATTSPADGGFDNRIRYYNTIGQDYEKLNKIDSALKYYDSSLHLAEKTKQLVWIGISSGYKGQVLYAMNEYEIAKPLLTLDYNINKNEEADIAAKSCQWLARIDLAQGKKDSALAKARDALQVLNHAHFNYYLQRSRIREMCYYTLAEAFQATNNADSFDFYNQLKINLHDSLARIALESSMRLVQTKIANENIQHAVQELQHEKENEAKRRNMLIAGVGLSVVILLLYLKHVQLQQQHRADLLLHQKKMTETELASAKESLKQFTANIIEKTNLIEKLTSQIDGKDAAVYDNLLNDLARNTILTESSWENFKATFEKIHPDFFNSLKRKAANITVAEQRMAALIKLNLNAKQMATILGISVDSVHKAKQRLRQRMQMQNELMLEEALACL